MDEATANGLGSTPILLLQRRSPRGSNARPKVQECSRGRGAVTGPLCVLEMVNLEKPVKVKVKQYSSGKGKLIFDPSLLSASSQKHSPMNVTCIVKFFLDGHPETVAIVRIGVLLLPVKRGRPVLCAHHPDVVKSLCQHHYDRHLNQSIRIVIETT